MYFDEYSELALRTADPNQKVPDRIINTCLGLAGEAGEVCDLIKKWRYQGHAIDEDELISELGDVLWYVNLGADALGITLEQIASKNIEKLEKRYPDHKFNSYNSVNREV